MNFFYKNIQYVSLRDHSDSHPDFDVWPNAANFKDLNEFFAPGRGLFVTHLSSNLTSHVFYTRTFEAMVLLRCPCTHKKACYIYYRCKKRCERVTTENK